MKALDNPLLIPQPRPFSSFFFSLLIRSAGTGDDESEGNHESVSRTLLIAAREMQAP
jgi:hypothetical protein